MPTLDQWVNTKKNLEERVKEVEIRNSEINDFKKKLEAALIVIRTQVCFLIHH